MKKVLLSVLLSVFLFVTVFAVPFSKAKAQVRPWYAQDWSQYYSKVYEPGNDAEIFGERYTAASTHWVIYSILSWPFVLFFGPDLVYCFWSGNLTLGCLQDAVGEAIGTLGEFLGNILSPITSDTKEPLPLAYIHHIQKDNPISSLNYVQNRLSDRLAITEVSAQEGFGYSQLQFLQSIWKSFRDISYVLMVGVVIVFSFMIMFKVKINPQTIITVQSALPKIFVTLILITFSYAIAGLLIDITYVVIGLIGWVIAESGMNPGSTALGNFRLMTEGPQILGVSLGVFGLIIGYFAMFLLGIFFGGIALLINIPGIL